MPQPGLSQQAGGTETPGKRHAGEIREQGRCGKSPFGKMWWTKSSGAGIIVKGLMEQDF